MAWRKMKQVVRFLSLVCRLLDSLTCVFVCVCVLLQKSAVSFRCPLAVVVARVSALSSSSLRAYCFVHSKLLPWELQCRLPLSRPIMSWRRQHVCCLFFVFSCLPPPQLLFSPVEFPMLFPLVVRLCLFFFVRFAWVLCFFFGFCASSSGGPAGSGREDCFPSL